MSAPRRRRRASIPRCPSCGGPLLWVWTRQVCCRVGCENHGKEPQVERVRGEYGKTNNGDAADGRERSSR